MRLSACGLAVVLTGVLPSLAYAQAPWGPPKGEATVGATYQWLDADHHLFSHLTEPALTPLEIVRRVDYQTNSLDFGRVQSQALMLAADIGVTNHLMVSGSL